MKEIIYQYNVPLNIDEVIDLYKRTPLGERRPVDNPVAFEKMLKHANLVISAWHDGKLIGLIRSFSDFVFVTYLADLLVDINYQSLGIGKQLMEQLEAQHEVGCRIVLLAASSSNDYYPRIGFEHNPRAWVKTKTDD